MDDIHFMFGEMIQRCEQLFLSSIDSSSTTTGYDDIFLLPTFMEALANISKEIEQVRDTMLVSVIKSISIIMYTCTVWFHFVAR